MFRGLSEKIFSKLPRRIRFRLYHPLRRFYTSIERRVLHRGRDLPIVVLIETNSLCTRKCSYCPREVDKKIVMESEVFYSIIDQLKEWGFRGRICPHDINEPLTDKRLFDFIAYTRKQLPRNEIVQFTNGDLLTEEVVKKLIKAGVNEIKLSIHDPISKEKEAQLIELKNRYDIITLLDRREGKRNAPFANQGGLVDFKQEVEYLPYCYHLEAMTIRASGNICLCIKVIRDEYIMGNVKEEPVAAIWNNPKFKKLRSDIRKGKKTLPICQKCAYEKQ